MVSALCKGWNICDDVEFMDLEDGVFLVQFKLDSDARKVEDNNPWSFNGSLVAMRRWELDIAPFEITFEEVPLWLHIKRLPFEWNTEAVLSKLGVKAGKVLRVELGFSCKRHVGARRAFYT